MTNEHNPENTESPQTPESQESTVPSKEGSNAAVQGEAYDEVVTNVEILSNPIMEIYDKPLPSSRDLITTHLLLMDANQEDSNKRLQSYPNMGSGVSEDLKRWSEVVNDLSTFSMPNNELHLETSKREDALWRQKVNIDGEELGASRPRFGGSNSGIISGESALLKVNSILGLGAMVQVPLWHTGIWVTLKAPSEGSLLELERRLATSKAELGRDTSGLSFSNKNIYTVMHIVNFALDHVYDASVKNITKEYLKKHIACTDIPMLVWGLACASYPSGYDFARPCTVQPDNCTHIVTGKVNIGKLIWTDTEALSMTQRRMMSRRNEKVTEDHIKQYKDEHSRGGPNTVAIQEGLRLRVGVPSISEYETAGYQWVDGISRLLESSLGVTLKGDERRVFIEEQSLATTLRQYGHWVKEIEVGDELINDRVTIDGVLNTFSSDKKIRNTILQEVGKYIDNATISFIAIPKYSCPNCGEEQKGDTVQEPHPELLPLDPVGCFFTLLVHRVYKVRFER